MTGAVQPLNGPTQVTIERNGQRQTLTVDIARARNVVTAPGSNQQKIAEVGQLGVLISRVWHYNGWTAIGGTHAGFGVPAGEIV